MCPYRLHLRFIQADTRASGVPGSASRGGWKLEILGIWNATHDFRFSVSRCALPRQLQSRWMGVRCRPRAVIPHTKTPHVKRDADDQVVSVSSRTQTPGGTNGYHWLKQITAGLGARMTIIISASNRVSLACRTGQLSTVDSTGERNTQSSLGRARSVAGETKKPPRRAAFCCGAADCLRGGLLQLAQH